MKGLKKYLCAALILVMSSIPFCMEANALFGNTHFNLGKKIVAKSEVSLSESEKSAFLSGLVYADIGRFKLDKETGIDSDSAEFVEEMKKHVETTEERWFVRGFEMHVFQDKETGKFLSSIFGHGSASYLEYILQCSLLDAHFLKENGNFISNEFLDKFNFEQVSAGMNFKGISKLVGIPINDAEDAKKVVNGILDAYRDYANKDALVLYGDFIKKTYSALGFEVSLDDIYEQAANIVGAFAISATVAGMGKFEVPEALDSKIEAQSYELAEQCLSTFNI